MGHNPQKWRFWVPLAPGLCISFVRINFQSSIPSTGALVSWKGLWTRPSALCGRSWRQKGHGRCLVRWAAACELMGMIILIWKFVSWREIWDSQFKHKHTHYLWIFHCIGNAEMLPLICFMFVRQMLWLFCMWKNASMNQCSAQISPTAPFLWPASPRKMWSLERAAAIILVEQNSAKAVQAAAIGVNAPCVSHRSIGRTRFLPKCWLKLMMKMNSVFFKDRFPW